MTEGNGMVSRRSFLRAATATTATAGAAGTATAQEEEGGGGGGTETVVVGPGGELIYEPGTSEPLQIEPGTTVNFEWDSDNHNIVVDSQPEDAEWSGTEGGESETYDTGHEYSYTFEVLGSYEYYCSPHLTAGMEATIEVVESVGGEGGAPAVPQVPDSAKTLGVATTVAMAATLGMAFVFLKYGGEYDPDQ